MAKFKIGIAEIDQTLVAARASYVLLGSRPGVGKTMLACKAVLAMLARGERVAYFSMEMTARELTERMLAAAAGIPVAKLQRGQLDPAQRASVAEAEADLTRNLTIFDAPQQTFRQLRSRLAAAGASGERFDTVVLDYVQLMDLGGTPSAQKFAVLSDNLRHLSDEFGCNLLVLTQVNRGAQEPSNLRLSGTSEQDADLVLLLRELRSLTSDRRVALSVLKNRGGLIGQEVGLLLSDFDRIPPVIAVVEHTPAQVEAHARATEFLHPVLTERGQELWWHTANWNLDGRTPMELLLSEESISATVAAARDFARNLRV